jgi:Flp pilus assembly protein TadB
MQWIKEHPGQTTFIIIAGVVFCALFLISVHVLYALGFTATGVAAGAWSLRTKLEQKMLIDIKESAAAAIQSMIGAVKAGGIFSFL